MDLPPQPLSSPIQPQVPASSVQRPPSKFPLSAIIMAVVVLIILVVGFFAAKSILSLNKKNQPVELTYWGLWESESVVKPLIDEYQSAHLKVKINYIFQSPREYRERLQTALSMSKGPDIFRIHNSWVPMFKNDLAPLPPAVYSASEFESVFYPTVKSDLRLSGNYVAVPLEIDGLAMYINDDLLAASALSVPATWEDLRVAAKALSVC